jgi:hypothetical protein
MAIVFCDPVSGSDSNDGSISAPFQSIGAALDELTPAGGFVICAPGDYGGVNETSGRSLNADIHVFSAQEYGARITDGLIFDLGTYDTSTPDIDEAVACGIHWYNFEISNDGDVVRFRCCDGARLVNCLIKATKWASGGQGRDAVTVQASANITISDCYMLEVNRGVQIAHTDGITVRRCSILPKQGSGIRWDFSNANGLIDLCYIAEDLNYNTNDPDAIDDPHASGISLRSPSITIKRTIIHGMGSTLGIGMYDDWAGPYEDVTIENCAIYGDGSSSCLGIRNWGDNILIRNNLFHRGYRQPQSDDGPNCQGRHPSQWYQYHAIFEWGDPYAGHDASDITFANNICIGFSGMKEGMVVDGNIYWCVNRGGYRENGDGTWGWDHPNGHIVVERDDDYSCSEMPLDFFESGFFSDTTINWQFPVRPLPQFPPKQFVEWFVNPTGFGANRGVVARQPSESLPRMGADWRLEPVGNPRDANNHDVGPYQNVYS